MIVYPSSRPFLRWARHQCDLADFGSGLTLRQFTSRFRSSQPALLRFDVEELGWTCLAACAPVGYALAGTDAFYGLTVRPLMRWSADFAIDDKKYAAFQSALRRSKVKKDDVPAILLWPYCGFSAYGDGSKTSFGKKASLFGLHRAMGWLATPEIIARIERGLGEVLFQSPEWAFCDAAEGTDRAPLPDAYPAAGVERLLGAPVRLSGEAASAQRDRLRGLMADLDASCAALVAGTFDPVCHYSQIVRPRVDLFYRDESAEPVLTSIELETLIKRVRFMHALRWPTLHSSVVESIARHSRPESSQFVAFRPVLAELETLRTELRTQHPWLGIPGEKLVFGESAAAA